MLSIRTDSNNKNFIELVNQLDEYLAIIDGEDNAFYAQFNKLDKIKYAVVAFDQDKPVSCGVFREYSPGVMKIKRMYTVSGNRGKGIAGKILAELEMWAGELSYHTCILETGTRQPDAIAL